MCRIYVKELLELGVEKGSAEIHPKKYSVVAADNRFRGEIQVGVTFTKKVLQTSSFSLSFQVKMEKSGYSGKLAVFLIDVWLLLHFIGRTGIWGTRIWRMEA